MAGWHNARILSPYNDIHHTRANSHSHTYTLFLNEYASGGIVDETVTRARYKDKYICSHTRITNR